MTVTQEPPTVDLSNVSGPLNEDLARKIDARVKDSLTNEKLRAEKKETIAQNERDRSGIQDDLWRVLTPTDEWFRAILRSFLLVYVVGLATVMAWFRTSTSHSRLFMIPALLLPAAYQFALRPINRRIAVRGALRRTTTKGTAVALVISSGLLATSLIMADAVRQVQDRALARNLGPIDAIMVSPSPGEQLKALAAIDARESLIEVSQRKGSHSIKQSIDGQLMITSTTSFVSDSTGRTLGAVDAIELDIEQAKLFGADSPATGLQHASALPLGAAYVGADLAEEMNISRGSSLTARADGVIVQVTVAGVLPRKGFGALTLDGRPRPRVMLLPPGFLSTAAGSIPGRVRYVTLFSLIGNPRDTWKRSANFTETLRQVLSGESAVTTVQNDGVISGDGDGAIGSPGTTEEPAVAVERIDGYATALKADFRETVSRSVDALAPMSSGLAAVAGVSAAASLVMALWLTIRRRQQELHALRAVGLSRSDAFGILAIELGLISLSAVFIGSALGWFVSGLALRRVRPPGRAFGDLALDLSVAPRSAAWSTGFAMSFFVCMVTVFLGGIVHARGWVSGGLRRQKGTSEFPRWSRVLAVILSLVSTVSIVLSASNRSGVFMLACLGGLAASLLVAAPLFPIRVDKNLRNQVGLGFGLVAFALAGVGLAGTVLGSLTPASFTLFSMSLVLLACLALPNGLTARLPRNVQEVLLKVTSPVRAVQQRSSNTISEAFEEARSTKSEDGKVLRKRVANPTHDALLNVLRRAHATRSPLHGIMIRTICALVIFIAIASAVLNASVKLSIRERAAESRGRFSAIVYNADAGALTGIRATSGVGEVVEVTSAIGLVSNQSHAPVRVRVASVDASYAAETGVARLSKRAPQYASDEDVFKAVSSDGNLAIFDASVLGENSSVVGQRIFLVDVETQRSTSLTVIGVTRATAGLGEVIVNRSAFDVIRNGHASTSTALVRFGESLTGQDGQDGQVASRVDKADPAADRAGIATMQTSFNNIEVYSFADVTRQALRASLTIASLLTQLSRLLLLGGIGAGVVVLRSALADRRRDLAGLRAMGAIDKVLSEVISSEYRLAARTGALVGLVVGLLAAWRLVATSPADLLTSIPVLRIALLLVLLAVIARAVLWVTTRDAMKGAPADVLRGTRPTRPYRSLKLER